jgi:hypothetical protein
MDIGKESERHESFQKANKLLQESVSKYIMKYKLKNVNFTITGHSRGAAVANLLAVDLNNDNISVPFNGWNTVCAYTFATPNNSKSYRQEGNENIFNFCFDDDFVTRVPLDKGFSDWGYGKSGITYRAVAANLYDTEINDKFKQLEGASRSFDYSATLNVLKAFHTVAPTVKDYYEKMLKMGITIQLDAWGNKIGEKDKTLHDFMRDYVAQAIIDNGGEKKIPYLLGGKIPQSAAVVGLAAKLDPLGNDVHEIAKFFVVGGVFVPYIFDTHQPITYYNALTTNGFLTK